MSRKIIKSKFELYEEKIEAIAEVSEKQEPLAPNKDLKYVGKKVRRYDGYDKVSGTAKYTIDMSLPNMAYAKTLRSPHPNAKIKSIDIKDALELKGVLHIVTADNTKEIPWYYETSVLFDKHLRYEGDEIACVAAETEKIAQQAIELIKVKYEILPFAVRAEDAKRSDAPKIHEWGNLGRPANYERGNYEQGIAEAEEVIEETYTTQVEVHNPTEVHCSLANWDGDKLTVWDSTQAIFSVRDNIAKSLNIPESNVRVIKKYMGGGFGSKLEVGKYAVMAALLAKEIGRPVKIALDRKEMNLAVGNRPDSNQTIKIGAKKDGTFTAMSHIAYGAMGAYPSGASCFWPLRSIYKCPNVYIQNESVLINAGRARPFRAPGHVQGTFALESIIDKLAYKLGIDPLELRMKNYSELDQDGDQPYTSKRLKEAYLQGSKAINWDSRNKKPGSQKGHIKTGIGMGSQIWWGGGSPPSYATLKLNSDGSALIMSGTQDIGGGTYTFMQQITAEVLEIPLDKVNVMLGDTGTMPYGVISGGSLTAPTISPAVYDAAVQMKNKLISSASAILDVPENELVYKNGEVSSSIDSKRKIGIPGIISKMNEKVLVTTGARNENIEGYSINSFGAQFAEVEVDILTGQVKLKKIVAAHDIGRVLNQQTLENQFHGGIVMGIGYALYENRVIDEYTGKVLTTNLHDYKMATIKDVPEMEIIIVSDEDNLISPTGVKGIGEPAMIPTPAAIANAVYNAIGVQITSLPITPDKILTALNNPTKQSGN
jgi:xanthine dehydrogenase YagR molybdenum-binding subunit